MVKNGGACGLFFSVKLHLFYPPSLCFSTVYQYLTFVDAVIEIHEIMIYRYGGHP